MKQRKQKKTVEVKIFDLGGDQRGSLVISQYCNILECKKHLKLDANFILLNGNRAVKETEDIRNCKRHGGKIILTLFNIKTAVPETIQDLKHKLYVTVPSWKRYLRGEYFRSDCCEVKHSGLFNLLVFPRGTKHSCGRPSIFVEANEPQKDEDLDQKVMYYCIRLVNWGCLSKSLIRMDEHAFTSKYKDRGWHDYLDSFPNCNLEDGYLGPLETLYFTADILVI